MRTLLYRISHLHKHMRLRYLARSWWLLQFSLILRHFSMAVKISWSKSCVFLMWTHHWSHLHFCSSPANHGIRWKVCKSEHMHTKNIISITCRGVKAVKATVLAALSDTSRNRYHCTRMPTSMCLANKRQISCVMNCQCLTLLNIHLLIHIKTYLMYLRI